MWLADELVHLGVRREVHDEVDLRVLDAVDPAAERGVVPGEVLEQVRKLVRPGVLALVDAEDLVTVPLQPEREVGPDLAGRAGDEDLHATARVERCRRLRLRSATAEKGTAGVGRTRV